MQRLRRTLLTGLAVWLSILAGGVSASAAEYKDPSGYSFRYPDGWVAVTQLSQQELPPELREWLQAKSIDLSRLSVLVIDPDPEALGPNCNVVIVPNELPINDAMLQTLRKGLAKQFEGLGVEVKKLQGEIRTMGANQVILFDFDSRMPFDKELRELHQRQAYIAGGGKTYIATCSATADRFIKHEFEFNEILSSIQVPSRKGIAFDWKQISPGTIGGIVGGIAGGLIAVLRRKKTPAPGTPASPGTSGSPASPASRVAAAETTGDPPQSNG